MIGNLVRSALAIVTAFSPVRLILAAAGRAGLLPASIWTRLPVTATFRVYMPDGKSFQYKATARDGVARELYWRGPMKYYEQETVEVFYELAKRALVFLDIGASSGLYTMLACAASEKCRVVCFEPAPETRDRLRDHIEMNGWKDRCEIRHEAVSDEVGTATLCVPFYPINAALCKEEERKLDGLAIEVPVTTVDEACGQKVDLVKIDVEGFEDKVVLGMRRTLVESRPTIVVECEMDRPFQTVESILAQYGYRFYHLRKEGPVPVDHIVPDDKIECRNFLCTTRDLDDLGLR